MHLVNFQAGSKWTLRKLLACSRLSKCNNFFESAKELQTLQEKKYPNLYQIYRESTIVLFLYISRKSISLVSSYLAVHAHWIAIAISEQISKLKNSSKMDLFS